MPSWGWVPSEIKQYLLPNAGENIVLPFGVDVSWTMTTYGRNGESTFSVVVQVEGNDNDVSLILPYVNMYVARAGLDPRTPEISWYVVRNYTDANYKETTLTYTKRLECEGEPLADCVSIPHFVLIDKMCSEFQPLCTEHARNRAIVFNAVNEWSGCADIGIWAGFNFLVPRVDG